MITCRSYDLPLRTPYEWARGRHERRQGMLVALDIGRSRGWGEVAPAPDHPVDRQTIQADVERLTEDLDPLDMDFLPALDRRDPDPRIRCALSTAWWDANAKQQGISLGRAVAEAVAWPFPAARQVPCNALITGAGPTEVLQATEAALRSGFKTLKLKLHGDRLSDMERVRAVREAAPSVRLRLDANGSWPTDRAADRMAELAPYGIEYVEQPVAPAAERTLTRLTAAGIIDVALDESATDPASVDRLLEDGAGHVVIVKPQRVGGPDRALATIQAALRHDARAVVTNSLETSVGVHAALHVASLIPVPVPACGLATSRFLGQDVAPPPEMDQDRMPVPAGPGSGVEVA